MFSGTRLLAQSLLVIGFTPPLNILGGDYFFSPFGFPTIYFFIPMINMVKMKLKDKSCPVLTDVQGRSQEPAPFLIPVWGSNWGYSGFTGNQNNRGSSGAYVTCIYCSPSFKINTRQNAHCLLRSWTHLICVCFCVCGRLKPKYSQFEPYGWRSHYTRQFSRSGISLVCLFRFPTFSNNHMAQTSIDILYLVLVYDHNYVILLGGLSLYLIACKLAIGALRMPRSFS